MAEINLREIHDTLVSLAKQAGERIVSATPSTDAAGSKKNCACTLSTHPLQPPYGCDTNTPAHQPSI